MNKLSKTLSKSSIGVKKRQSNKSATYSNLSVREDVFITLFKKFCVDFNTIIPSIQIVACEPPVGSFSELKRSSKNLSKYSIKRSIKKDARNRILLIYESEDQEDVAETLIFMKFPVDEMLLKACRKTLQAFKTLKTLKLEFCNLTNVGMRTLKRILVECSTINELSVRGNPNPYQNFYILLKSTNLQYFNASFCQINNRGADLISRQLSSYSPQTLIYLNLASNFIENEGVKSIANALRVNRTLIALNLSDNWMDDNGCKELMSVLKKFELKHDEIVIRRRRRFEIKKKLIKLNQERSTLSLGSKQRKSLSLKSASIKSVTSQRKTKRKSSTESRHSGGNKSPRSRSLTSHELTSIKDSLNIEIDEHPFVLNSFPENKKIYCKGNFHLAHLNLSYNKIHLGGIQAILQMLLYQKNPEMEEQIGLVNLNIEGICICYDITLTHINSLLHGNSMKSSVSDEGSLKRPKEILVFVYGTLKKGEPNHYYFGKDAGYWKFLSEAQSIEKYPLIVSTKYNIPFLLFSPGNGYNVKGELYQVDEKMLTNLDELENHPNFYIREVKTFKRLDNEENVDAWVYFIKQFRKDLLNKEMLESYSNEKSQLKYVERYQRARGVDIKHSVCSEESTLEDL